MGGVTYSLDSTINQVRTLLDEQYRWSGDGFTIWKELIQNANDADETTEFHIGWCRGIERATHPLLKTPALFVVNDGHFRDEDARSITRFGDNDKRDKEWQIGRFGLGMKSVFHLAEAFFYFASDAADEKPGSNSAKRADIFSPWIHPEGRPPYPTWDTFDDEQQGLIRKRLKPILDEMRQWFCVWIPLRHPSHLEVSEQEPLTVIGTLYFESEDRVRSLFSDDHARRVAELLPLLDRIKRVSIWEPSAEGLITKKSEVRFAEGSSSRRSLPHELATMKAAASVELNPFSGTIEYTVAGTDGVNSSRYLGIEHMNWNSRCEELRGLLPKDRKGKDGRVKAIPHAAVRFMEIPAQPGEHPQFSINWCVFLPLSKDQDRPVSLLKSMPSVSLHLHGYFFVDAGRNRIWRDEAVTNADSQISDRRPDWNHFIEDEGTLPLIIPALDQFVRQMDWSEQHIRKLTATLRETSVWKKHAAQICRFDQWGFIVESDAASGDLIGQWRKFDANCQVLTLPRATSSGLPLKVFPKLFDTLADASEAFRLTFEGEPRLAAPAESESPRTKHWPKELCASLLKSVDLESLIPNEDQCQYLLKFLHECCGDLRDSLGDWPSTSLRDIFAKVGLALLSKREELVQRLVTLIHQSKRVCAAWATSRQIEAQEFFTAIASMNLPIVVVPPMCDPADARSIGRLRAADCEAILTWLSDWERKLTLEPEEFAKFVAWVSKTIEPGSRDRIIDSKGAVIQATEYARGIRVRWLSPQEVLQAKAHGDVFADPKNGESLRELSEAFVNFAILNLVPELADAVFEDESRLKFPRYSIDEVVRVANQCGAPLSGSEKRFPLLERLRPRDSIDGHSVRAKAIRYLLHGNLPHRTDVQTKLIQPASDKNDDVWQKLAQWTMEKSKTHWRLLAPDTAKWVGEKLLPGQRNTLGIVPLDNHTVTDLLTGIEEFSDFPCDLISESAYGELLDKVPVELLKRLPIYRRVTDGIRVAITAKKSYWWSDFALDAELANDIELLYPEGGQVRCVRRESLTKSLSAVAAIEIALRPPRPDPSRHWQSILSAISCASDRELTDDLCVAIRSGSLEFPRPWLPTAFGPRWPSQVVNLPDIDVELCRLRDTIKGEIVFQSDIDESVRAHPAFAKLSERQLLPDPLQSLDLLKPWMTASSDCRTGISSLEAFCVWIELPWDKEVMPAHDVLKAVWMLCGEKTCFQQLAVALGETVVPFQRAIKAIRVLEEGHPKEPPNRKQRVFDSCFVPYVTQAIQQYGWQETLSSIQLPSGTGEWRSPKKLTEPSSHIAPDDQVEADAWMQLEPLRPRQQQPEQPNRPLVTTEVEARTLEERLVRTAKVLDDYFVGWDSVVRAPVIGGFLALLGDHKRVHELARSYLKPRTIQFVRDAVLPSRPFTPSGLLTPDNLRVEVVIERGETLLVNNLLGTPFSATRGNSERIESLMVDLKTYPPIPEIWVKTLRLVPPPKLSRDLRKCLLNTAVNFLSAAYVWKQREEIRSAVEQLFNVLENSDQCDVQLAQETFIEHAELLLRQLNLTKVGVIGEILQQLSNARLARYDDRQRAKLGIARTGQESRSQYHEAKERLRKVFESADSAEVHDQVLAAVRRKIQGDNRYEEWSVPFELFQNADDAAADRVAYAMPEPAEFSLDVFEDGQCLAFRHFGRCVNEAPKNNTSRTMADDLSGMLTPWLSTKGEADQTKVMEPRHTGKFGLGFKCVFLISSRPQLLSGELACEIVSGLYPVRIPAIPDTIRSDIFGRYLHDEQLRPLTTVLKLPLDSGANSTEVLGRFREIAHIQVIFGRTIHRLRFFRDPHSHPETLSWVPKVLFKGCSHGAIPKSLELSKPNPPRAVLLQVFQDDQPQDRIGEILLAYDASGFRHLDDVPTVWVTAPVQEARFDIGFSINGDFELDPGRANLAPECQDNRRLAKRLGLGFGARLADLFRRAESNWQGFCDEMQLASKAQPYEFWHSLWKLLTERVAKLPNDDGHTADRLVRRILWDEEFGMATQFYRDHAALPNCLPDGFQKLIGATDAKFAAKGVLLKVLGAVESWPSVSLNVSRSGFRNCVVAKNEVEVLLTNLAPKLAGKPIHDLNLEKLIEWEAEIDPCLEPKRAALIAAVLLREPLSLDQHRAEMEQIKGCLKQFRFLDSDGTERPAASLLIAGVSSEIGSDDNEDALIAAFAPPSRVLASEYRGESVRLFKICRGQRQVKIEDMVEWALYATSEQQTHVIDYLTRGVRCEQLRAAMKGTLGGTWLAGRENSALFQDAESRKQQAIYEILQPQPDNLAPILPAPERPVTDPKADLERIYQWWMKNREKLLPTYEHNVYPFGIERSTLVDADLNQLESRKHWMTLFMLGISHTMGAFRFAQHRDFIQLCNNKGILDQLADRSLPPGAWHQKVLDYVDSGTGSGDTIEYFHWLKQMVGASVISRWLDVYRHTFLATNKNIPFGFGLQDITCPRNSSHFRGAGPAFSAPPLRQVLGMGACFVMRELARRAIIQNRQAFRFCFVPHLRTCVLLSQIGCSGLRTSDRGLQSQRIFEFLSENLGEERATFDGAFDIPFLMLEYFGKSKRFERHQRLFKRQIETKHWPTTSTDEGWRTLPDGRRIKLW